MTSQEIGQGVGVPVRYFRLTARQRLDLAGERVRAWGTPWPVTVAVWLLMCGVVAVAVRQTLLVLLVCVGAAALLARLLAVPVRRRLLGPAQSAYAKLPPGGRWLPFAWLVLVFLHTTKVTQRSLEAANSGVPSIDNLVEIGVYAVIAFALMRSWLPGRGPLQVGTMLLFAWPLWAVLSSSWSLIPPYTFVRGLELLIPVLLAVYSARVLDRADDDGMALIRPVFTWLVHVTVLLALLALVVPPAEDVARDRLSWYGAPPIVASQVFAMGVIVLAIAGPRLLRFALWSWVARLGLLLFAEMRTQGRTAIVGLVVALAVALWVRTRDRPQWRFLSVTYYVSLFGVGVFLFFAQVMSAANRGEGTQRLSNLNGRTGLWKLALEQLDTVRDVFLGIGLGASRVVLGREVAFAGHAHNAFVEALLDTGVIGLVLFTAWLVRLAWKLRLRNLLRPLPPEAHAPMVGVFVLLFVLMIGSPEPALPGFANALLCFMAIVTLRSPSPTGERRAAGPGDALAFGGGAKGDEQDGRTSERRPGPSVGLALRVVVERLAEQVEQPVQQRGQR